MNLLPAIVEFEWNAGNRDKNKTTHKVEWWECEEVFFNYPLFTSSDVKHSEHEKRAYAFGHTTNDRLLAIVYTVRGNKIGVISAREMNKKEKMAYHEKSAQI
jgi:uncharacterized protein